jgi:dipeptidase
MGLLTRYNRFILINLSIIILIIIQNFLFAEVSDWEGGRPDKCTTIMVGKKASSDGSVMTSHTCDSHRTPSWMDIQPARKHKKGAEVTLVKRAKEDSLAMPLYKYVPSGKIPQVEQTYGFINTAYPCMNDHQLAIGESTFGGRESLHTEKGLIDCEQLVQLMIERCSTARQAIKIGGELVEKYGWIDEGECLTIADKTEAWVFEIVGPGKGNLGAVWVAQRVPDNHISVNANASRIRQIDLDNPDYFMASDNIFKLAQDSTWWDPTQGAFEFCYAYDPGGRTSFAARRREWRVFDLVAPSYQLDANAENFPFSVKPDTLVTVEKMVEIFQDYYEGTPYNGWDWRGERTIARWYTMYATITQSREWLPDEVGGVTWMALDNVASSIYIPIYCSVTDLPESYKTPGRENGFNRKAAWWAFNRLGTLTAQRWGDMRHDVTAVWGPMQQELFMNQKDIEDKALELLKKDRKKTRKYLTEYTNRWGTKVVQQAWDLGDLLWTRYDEKF